MSGCAAAIAGQYVMLISVIFITRRLFHAAVTKKKSEKNAVRRMGMLERAMSHPSIVYGKECYGVVTTYEMMPTDITGDEVLGYLMSGLIMLFFWLIWEDVHQIIIR